MKSAVVRELREPVVLEERPVPEPGAGQVLVRIEASGLCQVEEAEVEARLVFDLT